MLVAAETVMNPRREIVIYGVLRICPTTQKSRYLSSWGSHAQVCCPLKFECVVAFLKPGSVQRSPYALLWACAVISRTVNHMNHKKSSNEM
jgi:hypothetical protein